MTDDVGTSLIRLTSRRAVLVYVLSREGKQVCFLPRDYRVLMRPFQAIREIQRLSRQGKERVRSTCRCLVQTAQATVRQAEQVLTVLKEQKTKAGGQFLQALQTFLPRLKQVLEQTVRRVFENEPVPAEEKLVSIFEPHSDIIRRGKPRKSAEFGTKLDDTGCAKFK